MNPLLQPPCTNLVQELRVQLEEAEKHAKIFDEFDILCKARGYKGYSDFCKAYKFYQRAYTKLNKTVSCRTALRDSSNNTSNSELVKGKELEDKGLDLVQISRELGISFQTVRKYATNNWKLRKVGKEFSSWRLTYKQKTCLRLASRGYGSQGKYIQHAMETLGEEGVRAFVRSDMGRGSQRYMQKLHLSNALIASMDDWVSRGVAGSKQAILDACIGN